MAPHLRVAKRGERPPPPPVHAACSLRGCGREAAYLITAATHDPLRACRYHLSALVERIEPRDLSLVLDRIGP